MNMQLIHDMNIISLSGGMDMVNQRLLIKLSQMYYEQNLSQKEIAETLGISRPQISRMLQKAKEENIVSIKINNPFWDETELEKKLIAQYGLNDALVVNTTGFAKEALLDEFGRMVASYLDNYIADGDVVGVMSGRTIASLIQGLTAFPRRGLKIVPLVGGLGSRKSLWHANSIAQEFAVRSSSMCYTLNAPSVMQSEAARDLLVKEPEIEALLKLGAACDVALVGIGQVENTASNVLAGGLRPSDIQKLKHEGAVGSVCNSYFNIKGEILHPDIERRLIGQTLESIKGTKTVALAVGDSKTEAIEATLKTGYVDVFITNLETAHHITRSQEKREETT